MVTTLTQNCHYLVDIATLSPLRAGSQLSRPLPSQQATAEGKRLISRPAGIVPALHKSVPPEDRTNCRLGDNDSWRLRRNNGAKTLV
jgi:hypothetical protein